MMAILPMYNVSVEEEKSLEFPVKFILTCYYDKNLNQTLAKSEPECYLNDLYVINQLNYKTSFQYANIIDKHK